MEMIKSLLIFPKEERDRLLEAPDDGLLYLPSSQVEKLIIALEVCEKQLSKAFKLIEDYEEEKERCTARTSNKEV